MKVLKESKQLSISEAEYYFIQFLFTESIYLLSYKYKDLYKAMFDAYQDVYIAGKKSHIDVMDINKKFKSIL